MASPIALHLIPDVPFKITFSGDESDAPQRDAQNWDESTYNRTKYRVNSVGSLPLKTGVSCDTSEFDGSISPTFTISLPPYVRKSAAIPEGAIRFAYMHPPKTLNRYIDWETLSKIPKPNFDVEEPSQKHSENAHSLAACALLGGYVYFGKGLQVLGVNAISIELTKNELRFLGPFATTKEACQELNSSNRFHPLRIQAFQEAGIVAISWVRPMESFQSQQVTEEVANEHGAFVFMRLDNTAMTIIVDPTEITNPDGKTELFIDSIHLLADTPTSKYRFVQENMQYSKIKKWKEDIMNRSQDIDLKDRILNAAADLENSRTLIHKVCHASFGFEVISELLSDPLMKPNLTYQDNFGWTPLHYACTFSPQDEKLIKFLVELSPTAVIAKDYFDRYPIHLACDFHASEGVVKALLEGDEKGFAVKQKTKHLRALPLHFACNRKASVNTITALIDAHREGLREVTTNLALPLHLAVAQKLDASVIKVLLDEESRLKYYTTGLFVNHESDEKRDIYQSYQGRLPLHIACWNKSCAETVSLLLAKDRKNTTTKARVIADDWLREKRAYKETTGRRKSERGGDKSFQNIEEMDGMAALHLAMDNGNAEVVKLLLVKEKERKKETQTLDTDIGKGFSKLPSVQRLDSSKRNPLHIACEHGVEISIIQMLLELDPTMKICYDEDDQGMTPFHYACCTEHPNIETINLLLVAHERYSERQKGVGERLRLLPKMCDKRKRTPLNLAIRSNAPYAVIEILLRPKNFYLIGLNSSAIKNLAVLITECSLLQDHVISIFSRRSYFSVIMLEFYFNIIAFVMFIQGSVNVMDDKGRATEPAIILLCALFFLLRELIQMWSQSYSYILDVWSWLELLCIGLMMASAVNMFQLTRDPDSDIHKNTLIVTGVVLMLQFIFFMRSTFLPFARFVGGVLQIGKILVPFFSCTALLLFAFAYGFAVSNSGHSQFDPDENNCLDQFLPCLESKEIDQCEEWVQCYTGQGKMPACTGLEDCYLWVLHAFFFEKDETLTLLDVLFGIVITIILLNLVIAIVNEVWEKSNKTSSRMYWEYRLNKISESSAITDHENDLSTEFISSFVDRISAFVDGIPCIRYTDKIQWTKAPYNAVTFRDQYLDPFFYFAPDVAAKIMDAHSLQADLYWAKMERRRRDNSPFFLKNTSIIFSWTRSVVFYCLFIILGTVSAGLLWPRKFRHGVLSIGIRKNNPEI